ncbi:UNKNOWN [Stylonychia lemnae]|uniref:PH domain-containing protein n=1 Tax=Stylonychia lemnae TaxID=5949 RepID=A0A078A1G7_STYLE|nr:UNKNOWN [Stylonychia lemnae]|eukprot:CDW74624.1 UNKNOWN [Stylonychia lemnae]
MQTASIIDTKSYDLQCPNESYDSLELMTDEELMFDDDKLKHINIKNFSSIHRDIKDKSNRNNQQQSRSPQNQNDYNSQNYNSNKHTQDDLSNLMKYQNQRSPIRNLSTNQIISILIPFHRKQKEDNKAQFISITSTDQVKPLNEIKKNDAKNEFIYQRGGKYNLDYYVENSKLKSYDMNSQNSKVQVNTHNQASSINKSPQVTIKIQGESKTRGQKKQSIAKTLTSIKKADENSRQQSRLTKMQQGSHKLLSTNQFKKMQEPVRSHRNQANQNIPLIQTQELFKGDNPGVKNNNKDFKQKFQLTEKIQNPSPKKQSFVSYKGKSKQGSSVKNQNLEGTGSIIGNQPKKSSNKGNLNVKVFDDNDDSMEDLIESKRQTPIIKVNNLCLQMQALSNRPSNINPNKRLSSINNSPSKFNEFEKDEVKLRIKTVVNEIQTRKAYAPSLQVYNLSDPQLENDDDIVDDDIYTFSNMYNRAIKPQPVQVRSGLNFNRIGSLSDYKDVEDNNVQLMNKQGWLHKRTESAIFKKFKRRYMVLESKKLKYYEDSSQSKLIGCIDFDLIQFEIKVSNKSTAKVFKLILLHPLNGSSEGSSTTHSAAIQSNSSQSVQRSKFVFMTETTKDLHEWVDAINIHQRQSEGFKGALVLKYSSGKLVLFESLRDTGVSVCEWNKFINKKWFDMYNKVVFRKLHFPRSQGFSTVIEDFVQQSVGKKFKVNASKLLRKKCESDTQSVIKGDKTYFCSELVASAYKRLGILEYELAASKYWPGDFSQENGEKQVKFLNGAKLGEELLLDFII